MAKKKNTRTRGIVKGKNQHQRMEKAYQDWKSGKENSLKQLADKYHLHIPDVSKYITTQMQLSKKPK